MSIKQAWEEVKKSVEKFDKILEQNPAYYKMDFCKGCNKLFTQDELLAKGDELFCVGCLETDDGEKGEIEV